MVGVPHLATFHSTTKAMMSKVLLRGRPLNPVGGVDRQNLSGQKYLFPAWDRAKTISIHTQKQNPHVARFTHDRKVADSVPPVQRTTRDRTCAVSG